jgi:signal transduction histidine kinase
MIWLIIVQTRWIKNAIIVKDQQFNQIVNKALFHVVSKIEEHETVMQITNETVSFSSDTSVLPGNKKYFENVFLDDNPAKSKKPDVFIMSDDSSIYQVDPKNEKNSENNDEVYRDELKKKIIQKINKKTIFVENIINKLIRKEINIQDRINPDLLKKMIAESFKINGIDYKYEFGVRNENNEYAIKSKGFNLDYVEKTYEITLYPNDILSSPNYLVVYFNKDKSDILKQLPQTAYTSIILTLIISLTFSLTIYIIFKQRKLSEIKNDFISNMTHELKTPISTISLAAQMLKDSSLSLNPDRISSITGIIDDESKRLGFQVEKVLQTSIFEKGRIQLKFQSIDLHELINSIVMNSELKVKTRGGKIETKLTAHNPNVNADEMHITNVIFNLLDNAVKYTKDTPLIIISTGDRKGGIVLSVSDNGIGIGKEHQKKIFEKFYRVPKGNIHDVKGFGLGLNYVKKIVEEHTGTIKVKSELGKGTVFEIFLPVLEE